MSNFIIFTFYGYLHALFTLYNYLVFLADIIRLAPFSFISYVMNYPIPDDAPVIHIVFP
jgi:hypothetical protein